MASKIIVIGEVHGAYESTFKKIATLHAKNNFSLALVTGNLFGEDDESLSQLLDGKISIPLTTYYTVGSEPLPRRVIERLEKDEDVCENLHYLGKRSITKTSDGIRIAALGGLLDENIIAGMSTEQYLPFHTTQDATSLKGANYADILLTTAWPSNVTRGSHTPLHDSSSNVAQYDHIADLCQTLKPRYHFSSSPDFFYEREPFFHQPTEDKPDARPLTRFISMARTGNAAKQKALYALSLQKSIDHTAPVPSNATASPFSTPSGLKRRALDPAPYSRFANNDEGGSHKRRFARRRGPPPGPDTCYFCLSNPDIGTHLITSIGEDSYVTIAKGPLINSTTNSELGLAFPAHALIIPLAHEPTIASIPDPEQRSKTYNEMIKYKTALQNMISLRSVDQLGTVTYEISRSGIRHSHWQLMAVPVKNIRDGLVEAAFRVEAENSTYPEFQDNDVELGQGQGDFFRVWIWQPAGDGDAKNDGMTKCLHMPLDADTRFDLQFGRRVLAKLLGLEKRIQWRDCEESLEDETAQTTAFKEAFKPYDFTLED